MKDDAGRIPSAGPYPADTVALVDPVEAPSALFRALADRKQNPMSLA